MGSLVHPLHLTDCVTTSPTLVNLLAEEGVLDVCENLLTSTMQSIIFDELIFFLSEDF